MERRKQLRYPYAQSLICHVPSAAGEVSTQVLAANISPVGIALRLLQPQPKIGDLLRLELTNPQTRLVHPVTIRVVHLFERQHGDWLVGGVFTTALSVEEIDALLPASRPVVLVVEEDEEVRRMLEMTFTVHGS